MIVAITCRPVGYDASDRACMDVFRLPKSVDLRLRWSKAFEKVLPKQRRNTDQRWMFDRSMDERDRGPPALMQPDPCQRFSVEPQLENIGRQPRHRVRSRHSVIAMRMKRHDLRSHSVDLDCRRTESLQHASVDSPPFAARRFWRDRGTEVVEQVRGRRANLPDAFDRVWIFGNAVARCDLADIRTPTFTPVDGDAGSREPGHPAVLCSPGANECFTGGLTDESLGRMSLGRTHGLDCSESRPASASEKGYQTRLSRTAGVPSPTQATNASTRDSSAPGVSS